MSKCRMCGKQIDGSFGVYCGRCDKLVFGAVLEQQGEAV